MGKTCFLFGHREATESVLTLLEAAVEAHYRDYGVGTFIVGHYGGFDRLARAALIRVKKRCPEIRLYMLIPYHPADRPVQTPEGFEGTYYPPLEGVPKRYAIVRANRHMVQQADCIICYVRHFGNTRNLLEGAVGRGIPVHNLAEDLRERQPPHPRQVITTT